MTAQANDGDVKAFMESLGFRQLKDGSFVLPNTGPQLNIQPQQATFIYTTIQAARADEAKAYGGCKLCFGKSYATARVGTSSRYGNVTRDTIKPCTCDRGKQLERQLEQVRADERQALLVAIETAEELAWVERGAQKSHENIINANAVRAILQDQQPGEST